MVFDTLQITKDFCLTQRGQTYEMETPENSSQLHR